MAIILLSSLSCPEGARAQWLFGTQLLIEFTKRLDRFFVVQWSILAPKANMQAYS